MISPLVLIIPKSLEGKPISRDCLITVCYSYFLAACLTMYSYQSWRVIAGEMPRPMAKCSTILWNVLFKAATGASSLYDSLLKGLSECNEIALTTLNEEKVWTFNGNSFSHIPIQSERDANSQQQSSLWIKNRPITLQTRHLA
jgi:hypothetical protein